MTLTAPPSQAAMAPSDRRRIPRIISYDDAQALLGGDGDPISRRTLQRMIADGRIQAITINEGVRRIVLSSVERYLRNRLRDG